MSKISQHLLGQNDMQKLILQFVDISIGNI